MPADGTPRYARSIIYFDVVDMDDLTLGFNSQGWNLIGNDPSYIKVVRYGQTWTVTPVPAGEAGLGWGNAVRLSVPVPTPKRTYATRYGTCDLGTFDMPFELRLTCDGTRGTCPSSPEALH